MNRWRFCKVRPEMLICFAVLINTLCASVAGADQPVTEPEVRALGGRVEKSINQNDSTILDGLIDYPAIVESGAKGLSLPAATKTTIASGMHLGAVIAKICTQGGSYHFVSVRRVDGDLHPIFRLLTPQGAVNYHEMTLSRETDGQLHIVDIYVFTAGELQSQTLRRPMISLAASANRNAIQRLIGTDNDYMTHLDEVTSFRTQSTGGRWQQALKTYDGLPDSLKHDKTIMMLWVMDSERAGREAYVGAMSDYEKAFPGDPSLMLLEIDAKFLSKDYEGEIKTLDQLDVRVGGDAYLDTMRATARFAQSRAVDARLYLMDAIQREPTLQRPWELLLDIALKSKNNAEIVRLLDESAEKAGFRWTRVGTAKGFAEFVKSPEYAEWVKKNPQQSAAATPAR